VKDKTIKDLMVPLSEYATIHEDQTLFEALMALENTHAKLDPSKHRHRAILILDKKDGVVGKLSQWDVLKALEPRYGNIEDLQEISGTDFSPDFIKSMLAKHALWNKPLLDVCQVGGKSKVKDVMHKPTEGEFIAVNAPLVEAINQMIVGKFLSLLVIDDKKEIIGILKLIDIFKEVSETMKSCEF
jgi:CBS domain-containing protein